MRASRSRSGFRADGPSARGRAARTPRLARAKAASAPETRRASRVPPAARGTGGGSSRRGWDRTRPEDYSRDANPWRLEGLRRTRAGDGGGVGHEPKNAPGNSLATRKSLTRAKLSPFFSMRQPNQQPVGGGRNRPREERFLGTDRAPSSDIFRERDARANDAIARWRRRASIVARVPARRRGDPRRPAGRVSRLRCRASLPEPPLRSAFRAPPTTCSSGGFRGARGDPPAARGPRRRTTPVPRRVRVELPLPLADLDSDDLVRGPARTSGGLVRRHKPALQVTKGYVEDAMLDGYENEYLGLLDRDADGMGVWRDRREHDATLAHPSDTTAGFFRLLRWRIRRASLDPSHVVVVVNAFWSGNGGEGGAALGVRAQARGAPGLGRDGDWDKVLPSTKRRGPHTHKKLGKSVLRAPWRLYDARGTRVVLETETEPRNRPMGEALNEAAEGVRGGGAQQRRRRRAPETTRIAERNEKADADGEDDEPSGRRGRDDEPSGRRGRRRRRDGSSSDRRKPQPPDSDIVVSYHNRHFKAST